MVKKFYRTQAAKPAARRYCKSHGVVNTNMLECRPIFLSAGATIMHCPFCQMADTKVVDSRLVAEGGQVRRRRECQQCKERFTTFEMAELLLPRVIKQDGSRQPFDETKLRAGLQRALEKRPVSIEAIETAINHIKYFLQGLGEREVDSRIVGEKVMEVLRDLDGVAYVRFASVYRSFKDIDEFRAELDRLEKAPSQ